MTETLDDLLREVGLEGREPVRRQQRHPIGGQIGEYARTAPAGEYDAIQQRATQRRQQERRATEMLSQPQRGGTGAGWNDPRDIALGYGRGDEPTLANRDPDLAARVPAWMANTRGGSVLASNPLTESTGVPSLLRARTAGERGDAGGYFSNVGIGALGLAGTVAGVRARPRGPVAAGTGALRAAEEAPVPPVMREGPDAGGSREGWQTRLGRWFEEQNRVAEEARDENRVARAMQQRMRDQEAQARAMRAEAAGGAHTAQSLNRYNQEVANQAFAERPAIEQVLHYASNMPRFGADGRIATLHSKAELRDHVLHAMDLEEREGVEAARGYLSALSRDYHDDIVEEALLRLAAHDPSGSSPGPGALSGAADALRQRMDELSDPNIVARERWGVDLRNPPPDGGSARFQRPGGGGFIDYEARPDGWHIRDVQLDEGLRGRGEGVALYEQFLSRAAEAGAPRVFSDNIVSQAAEYIYPALRRRGYDIETSPKGALTRHPRDTRVHLEREDGQPIFAVRPTRERPNAGPSLDPVADAPDFASAQSRHTQYPDGIRLATNVNDSPAIQQVEKAAQFLRDQGRPFSSAEQRFRDRTEGGALSEAVKLQRENTERLAQVQSVLDSLDRDLPRIKSEWEQLRRDIDRSKAPPPPPEAAPPIRPPPRELGYASDGTLLPRAEPRPFSTSLRGGSDDLRDAARSDGIFGTRGPDGGGSARMPEDFRDSVSADDFPLPFGARRFGGEDYRNADAELRATGNDSATKPWPPKRLPMRAVETPSDPPRPPQQPQPGGPEASPYDTIPPGAFSTDRVPPRPPQRPPPPRPMYDGGNLRAMSQAFDAPWDDGQRLGGLASMRGAVWESDPLPVMGKGVGLAALGGGAMIGVIDSERRMFGPLESEEQKQRDMSAAVRGMNTGALQPRPDPNNYSAPRPTPLPQVTDPVLRRKAIDQIRDLAGPNAPPPTEDDIRRQAEVIQLNLRGSQDFYADPETGRRAPIPADAPKFDASKRGIFGQPIKRRM